MSGVMLDNWGLITCLPEKLGYSKSFFDSKEKREIIDLCWQNFLTAIVLWDSVFLDYPDFTNYSLSMRTTKERDKYRDIINKIRSNTNGDIFQLINRRLIPLDIFNETKREQFEKEVEKEYEDNKTTFLITGGLDYLMKANYLGHNYLPHPYRAEALQKSDLFEKGFIRTRYLELLNESVRKYIKSVNSLSGSNAFTVQLPVLYQYIHKNSKNAKEEFKFALSLREDINVVKLRESINKIENMLSQGNIYALDASLKQAKEICDEITNKMYRRNVSFGASLGLSPSINLDIKNSQKAKGKLHTTFLYDITKFALKGNIIL